MLLGLEKGRQSSSQGFQYVDSRGTSLAVHSHRDSDHTDRCDEQGDHIEEAFSVALVSCQIRLYNLSWSHMNSRYCRVTPLKRHVNAAKTRTNNAIRRCPLNFPSHNTMRDIVPISLND